MQRHELGKHSDQFFITRKLSPESLQDHLQRKELTPIANGILQNAQELFAFGDCAKAAVESVVTILSDRPDLLDTVAQRIGETAGVLGVSLHDPQVVYMSGFCLYEVVAASEKQARVAGKQGFQLLGEARKEMASTLQEYAKQTNITSMSAGIPIESKIPIGIKTGESFHGLSRLTPQEKELLRLVELGLSNKQIAKSLDRAKSTVKNNLSKLYAKLGVDARTKAAIMATNSEFTY